LTLLRVFQEFKDRNVKRGREWCNDHQINYRAMAKAVKINDQLSRAAVSEGIKLMSSGENSDAVLRSLVAGFFMNAAHKDMDGSFKVFNTGQKLKIHPSSVLFQAPPDVVRIISN